MKPELEQGDSYVVNRDGLNGVREHWMPGNCRRGTGPREKRAFASEAEARSFIEANGLAPDSGVYRCGVCGAWHTASPPRGRRAPRAMATPTPPPADTPVNSTWLPGPRCTNCGEGPLRRKGLCGWCEPVTERSAA